MRLASVQILTPILCSLFASAASAQFDLVTCVVTSEAPLLRSEGRAELTGDIRFYCTGGDPASVRFINLAIFLNAPITSDLTGPGPDDTEALLLIDEPLPGVVNSSNGVTYEGQVLGEPGAAPGPPGGPGAPHSGNVYRAVRAPGRENRLEWNGVPFVPAPKGKSRILRIVNVRADVTGLRAAQDSPAVVMANLAANPLAVLPLGSPAAVVGYAVPGLKVETQKEGRFELRFEERFSSAFRKRIENAAAGAGSARLQAVPETEYFTESGFTPEFSGTDPGAPGAAASGTRFVAYFSDLPDGVYLVAPASVASVDPGSNPAGLEARRVLGFGPDYAGGVLQESGAPAELVPVAGGRASLVYEVVASPPFDGVNDGVVTDVFRIPVRAVFPQPVRLGGASVVLNYAPVDETAVPSGPSPEPRFTAGPIAGSIFALPAGWTPDYLTFDFTPGDPAPAARDLKFQGNRPGVPGSIRITTATGGAWLSAAFPSGAEPKYVTVRVDPKGLPPGVYQGAVTLRMQDSPADLAVIPVVFTVLPAPEIAVDLSEALFQVPPGGPAPAPAIRYLNARNKAYYFRITVATVSGGDWLSASPLTGGTPKNLVISVDPRGLGPGTYEGSVTIASDTAANSPQSIPVRLVVAPPVPAFTASGIVSAASYQGGAVSPGELVTIFGALVGPPQPAGARLDENGRLATLVAGTRILFDGVAAPLVGVSATQSSCIVPYEIAGQRSVNVEVEVDGARSPAVHVPATPVRPGIFTADSSGRGPGAILNEDGALNSPAAPASRGSAVAIFWTGAGQTVPAGVNGQLNDPRNPAVPQLPVRVLVGGREMKVEYAGGAPGLAAGVMQANIRLDPTVPAGPAVPLEIVVAATASQPGVTLAVR